MSLAIVHIGTAVPDTILDRDSGPRAHEALSSPTPEQASWLRGMYDGTRIDARRTVLPSALVRDLVEGTRESGSIFLPQGAGHPGPTTGQRMEHYARLAPPLALRAAEDALAGAGVPAASLSHLITVSCTGFLAPGLDRVLIEGLPLRRTVQRTHVGYMGCHGALNGLRVASAFAATGATVLLCAVELCSLHYHYGLEPQKLVANAIFSDGAAAVVGVPAARAEPGAWRVLASGSCLVPDSAEAMTWTIGDHGFEMTLARHVPALVHRHLRPWLEGWLLENGMALAEVGSWAVHPGGPKVLDAVEQGLNLPADALAVSREVFRSHGNMSSPTILFILQRLRQRGAARPCVALGFGPGLMVEVALLG